MFSMCQVPQNSSTGVSSHMLEHEGAGHSNTIRVATLLPRSVSHGISKKCTNHSNTGSCAVFSMRSKRVHRWSPVHQRPWPSSLQGPFWRFKSPFRGQLVIMYSVAR